MTPTVLLKSQNPVKIDTEVSTEYKEMPYIIIFFVKMDTTRYQESVDSKYF